MIECRSVTLIRDGQVLLDNVDWQVKKHEHWAVLGLNGAGKTLLLQMICGYVWPTDGELNVLGFEFGKDVIPALQRKIGWVSSALQTKNCERDSAEMVVLSGKFSSIGIHRAFAQKDLQDAINLLCDLGGNELIGKPLMYLSQGERQLVLIARALMSKPELLVLDEPCNGLDILAKERLLKQIKQITEKETDTTLIYVTHHADEILPCFENLLLLKKGGVYAKGGYEELFNESCLSKFYGTPITIQPLKDGRHTILLQ